MFHEFYASHFRATLRLCGALYQSCVAESQGVGIESARRLIIIFLQNFESKVWKSLCKESTDKIDIGPLRFYA